MLKPILHSALITAAAGQNMTNEQIHDMLNEAPGTKINFMVFLTMMADKLTGTDPEHVITSAFAAFDDSGKGTINADYLRDCMTTMGDRFTDEEVIHLFNSFLIVMLYNPWIYIISRSILCFKARPWMSMATLTTRTLCRFSSMACSRDIKHNPH